MIKYEKSRLSHYKFGNICPKRPFIPFILTNYVSFLHPLQKLIAATIIYKNKNIKEYHRHYCHLKEIDYRFHH